MKFKRCNEYVDNGKQEDENCYHSVVSEISGYGDYLHDHDASISIISP